MERLETRIYITGVGDTHRFPQLIFTSPPRRKCSVPSRNVGVGPWNGKEGEGKVSRCKVRS